MPTKPAKFRQIQGNENAKFKLLDSFKLGYRNREDKTNLPAGVLIQGSQNVLTNTSGRISIRKGYTLDGQAETTVGSNIQSSYDWFTSKGYERNLRAGFLSATNNGKLQYRYVASAGDYYNGTTFTAGQIYWIDLVTSQTSVSYNFATIWNSTGLIQKLLFVNGAHAVSEWTGGVVTMLSATSNTITLKGALTWEQLGFNPTTGSVTINGTDYAYTGGTSTLTLTGVSGSPAAEPVNSVIHQTPVVTSSFTTIPSTFNFDLIAGLANHIFYGDFKNNTIYLSKEGDYTSAAESSPRIASDGGLAILQAPPTSFIPQETDMYAFAGMDLAYRSVFKISADNVNEAFGMQQLKTTGLQGAQSQAWTTKIKNNIAYLSFEPIINSLGLVQDILSFPQVTDLSFSIVNDLNAYDPTGGSNFYYRNFLYSAFPAEGLVRVYNMTDPEHVYWEAPLILPISRFSVINGELYGHSSQVGETYKLFTGFNDNGNIIQAIAKFSYQHGPSRAASNSFNEFYVEGYISSNTTLNLGLEYDIDGCATNTNFDILGTNTRIVCILSATNSLGKNSLGKEPLGGQILQTSNTALPPKFRVIQTFPRVPYYEFSPSFSSEGIDQQWEILCFGPSSTPTTEGQNNITV